MNLRKALDRAIKERADRGEGAAPHSVPSGAEAPAGCQSPVYSECKMADIHMPTALRNHCVAMSNEFAEVNYYKVLRTQFRQISRQNNWSTVMVTSANPGEGKTVTSINLAATFAREHDQTVLLVDADMRMQMVHRYLGYDSPLGLIDYLEGRRPSLTSSPGRESTN